MNADREHILWDSNRHGRATQRQFHAAVAEIRGERITVSPMVAKELAPQVDVLDLDLSMTVLEKELRRRREGGRRASGPGGTLEIATDLWRAREWARPDGLYGVRTLTTDEEKRKRALLEEAPLAIFTGAVTREDVMEDPDAHIICETLAMDAWLLMTHDKNTIKREPLSLWTAALARRSVVSHPNVVCIADTVTAQWTAEHPEEMLLASQLAAWPKACRCRPARPETGVGEQTRTPGGRRACRNCSKAQGNGRERLGAVRSARETTRAGTARRDAQRRTAQSLPRVERARRAITQNRIQRNMDGAGTGTHAHKRIGTPARMAPVDQRGPSEKWRSSSKPEASR